MADSSGTTTRTAREFTITRLLDAPRELAFRAWTDPAHFTQWWGPRGYSTPLSTISLDVRPGGRWRAGLISDSDGSEAPFVGAYREVVPPQRLVLTLRCPTDPDDGIVTVTFTERGEQTEMVFHQVVTWLDEPELAVAKAGWVEFFERLDEYLARAQAGAGR